jgi:hypothetical protein
VDHLLRPQPPDRRSHDGVRPAIVVEPRPRTELRTETTSRTTPRTHTDGTSGGIHGGRDHGCAN